MTTGVTIIGDLLRADADLIAVATVPPIKAGAFPTASISPPSWSAASAESTASA